MDFTHAEPILRDIVLPVVTALEEAGAEPGHLMLVGAVCRDVLHRAAGNTTSLRRTGDLDLAVAVDGWDHYLKLIQTFPRAGDTTPIRIRVVGTAVDLIPFGALEEPAGKVPVARHDGPMNVLGFGDVWTAATTVPLTEERQVRIPTAPGFTALKLSAWASRAPAGEHRDGQDLACAMFWYQSSPRVCDRLYDDELGKTLLERAELDTAVASVMLLVHDALSCLDRARQDDLRTLWRTSAPSADVLATYLENQHLPGWPERRSNALREYAEAVHDVLGG